MFFHANPTRFWFILFLLVLAGILFFFATILRGRAKFKLKAPLLSLPEQDLYRRLAGALPDHIILAQVAFSQMITVSGSNSHENFRKRLTARQKVADFVVCDKTFSIVAVVELDDSTHSVVKDEKRDAIIEEAGSKTVRWRVSRLPNRDDIRRLILGGV